MEISVSKFVILYQDSLACRREHGAEAGDEVPGLTNSHRPTVTKATLYDGKLTINIK